MNQKFLPTCQNSVIDTESRSHGFMDDRCLASASSLSLNCCNFGGMGEPREVAAFSRFDDLDGSLAAGSIEASA